MTASDIESLQPRASRGGRCLQAFLITSVIILFILLFGVTVTAALLIRQIQTELATLTKATPEPLGRMSYARLSNVSEYKVQNFAFVYADSGQLRNVTMEWKAESSNTVGSSYTFNEIQHTLVPHSEGSYLLYVDLVPRCRHSDPHQCGSVNITVQVKSGVDQERSMLECRASSQHGRAEKCWKVVRLGPQHRLVAWMEVRGNTENWELDTEQSGMGMFLVDGQMR